MGAPIFRWTEEAINELVTLYRSGKTYTQMAAHFGVTRNTISGKLDRTLKKLGERVERPANAKGTVPKRNYTRSESMLTLPRRAESVSKYVAPKIPAPDEGHLASIVDVTGCRWPVRDDAEFVGGVAFCNHKAGEGTSYCPYHAAAAKSKVKVKPILSIGALGLRFAKRAA